MEIELIIFVYTFLGLFYSIGFSNDKRMLFAVWLVWPIIVMFIAGYTHSDKFNELIRGEK